MVKTYISLTKPGIIWGNLIAATGGFMLAAQGTPDLIIYLITMLGIAFVIASGCVFNNVVDADIDSLMERTNERALVIGSVSKNKALVYATSLAFLGFITLAVFTNKVALIVAAFGFYAYVVLYTLMYKRTSVHGTLIGSLSGATPPIIGYIAVTGSFDIACLLIFIGFCAWQMPHSYAIGLFRADDFKKSQIPLLPLVKDLSYCRWQMVFYILLFLLSVLGLFLFSYVGIITLIIMTLISSFWLYQTYILYKPENSNFDPSVWGKKMFITSIITITLFSGLISIDYIAS